jgi:hypothetical protein
LSPSAGARLGSTKGFAYFDERVRFERRRGRSGLVRKLVLIVIDSLTVEMLDRAVEAGKAPALAEIVRRGTHIRDCVSVFPSVTPVASASIVTGTGLERHGVPSINWFHRGEDRYVEYGSSWPATRTFGVLRTLNDIVYNMNFEHLSRTDLTFFESLDDAGIRTACTPFLIFRGRTRHELALQGWMRRVAHAVNFRHAVYGPAELFYGELYASRQVDCRPTLARPGTRDAYSGCVGAYLAEYGLYDFLLFSLPDNDHHSHRYGPDATVTSIALADQSVQQLVDPSGGIEAFLEENAVIVMADHAQTPVQQPVRIVDAFPEWRVRRPTDERPGLAELAVSPGARSAMVYLLGSGGQRDKRLARVNRRLGEVEGVDLVMWKENGEACVSSARGELHFAPGTGLEDARGRRWDLDGALETLDGVLEGGRVSSPDYPDAFGRIWAALASKSTGEVLVSASPGYEFVDWGGSHHVGGGSHGSLHRDDSIVPLVFAGCGPDLEPDGRVDRQWSIADVAAVVRAHFGVGGGDGAQAEAS